MAHVPWHNSAQHDAYIHETPNTDSYTSISTHGIAYRRCDGAKYASNTATNDDSRHEHTDNRCTNCTRNDIATYNCIDSTYSTTIGKKLYKSLQFLPDNRTIIHAHFQTIDNTAVPRTDKASNN
jgi:hypothetical protein